MQYNILRRNYVERKRFKLERCEDLCMGQNTFRATITATTIQNSIDDIYGRCESSAGQTHSSSLYNLL